MSKTRYIASLIGIWGVLAAFVVMGCAALCFAILPRGWFS